MVTYVFGIFVLQDVYFQWLLRIVGTHEGLPILYEIVYFT